MNPFKYGRVVSQDDYCSRSKLEKQLCSFIQSAQNVLLEGPRRVGKTSLIFHSARSIKGLGIIYIDTLEIKTANDLCRRIIKSIAAFEGTSGMLEKLFKALAHLRPTLSVDPVTNLPSFSIEAAADLKPDHLEGLMDLISDLHKRRKFVVVFDEFQDILDIGDSREAIAILRNKIQFQTTIPYIFAGSIRNRMNSIFTDPDSPFFKSAAVLEVPSLDREAFVSFLVTKFASGKRVVSDSLMARIFEIAQDIPGDIQQLCSALWDSTSFGQRIDDRAIPEAMEVIYSREQNGYEACLVNMTELQLRCLCGLARIGGKAAMSSDFLRQTGVRLPGSVKKAMVRLEDQRLIFRENGEYKFVNPFFRSWLLKKGFY